MNTCIHDNRNGGIQATDGGNVTAVRNVIQLNRLGRLDGQGDGTSSEFHGGCSFRCPQPFGYQPHRKL